MRPDPIDANERNDLDSALALRLKALRIEEILGSLTGMSESCSALADIYTKRGEHRMALQMLLRALDIERSLGRSEMIADYSAEIGRLHAGHCGELKEAGRFFEQALQRYTASNRSEAVAACSEALAAIYQRLGRLVDAQEKMQQVLHLRSKTREPKKWIRSQLRLAEILLRRSKARDAAELLAAVEHMGPFTDQRINADLWGLQAIVCILSNRRQLAEPLLQKAMQCHIQTGNRTALADNLGNLANLCWAENRLIEAEQHYLCALMLYEREQKSHRTAKTLQLLLDLQRAKSAATSNNAVIAN